MDALLNVSGQVVLDMNGYGAIRIGPVGEGWFITRVMVSATSHVNEATCTSYQTNIGEYFQRDITYTGSTGDTSDTTYTLTDGDALWFVWTGGDAGATATVSISGTRTNPRGGFRAI